MAAKKDIKKAAVSPETQCKFEWDGRDQKGIPGHFRCEREKMAHDLCWTHYQQQRRGNEMKPIRIDSRAILPGNVRVEGKIFDAIEARVKKGHATSLYEATRQAIETGVYAWLDAERVIKGNKG